MQVCVHDVVLVVDVGDDVGHLAGPLEEKRPGNLCFILLLLIPSTYLFYDFFKVPTLDQIKYEVTSLIIIVLQFPSVAYLMQRDNIRVMPAQLQRCHLKPRLPIHFLGDQGRLTSPLLPHKEDVGAGPTA